MSEKSTRPSIYDTQTLEQCNKEKRTLIFKVDEEMDMGGDVSLVYDSDERCTIKFYRNVGIPYLVTEFQISHYNSLAVESYLMERELERLENEIINSMDKSEIYAMMDTRMDKAYASSMKDTKYEDKDATEIDEEYRLYLLSKAVESGFDLSVYKYVGNGKTLMMRKNMETCNNN